MQRFLGGWSLTRMVRKTNRPKRNMLHYCACAGFLSLHYQVEQLIFLFPHQSLLNNMHPNHEFSVAIMRMKMVPGEIATPSPSLPPPTTQSPVHQLL